MTHCVEHQAKRSEDPSLFPITLISNQRITINLLHNYSILVFDDLETNGSTAKEEKLERTEAYKSPLGGVMTMVLVPSHPMALRVRHVPPSRSPQAPRERLSASVKLFPNVYDCVRSLRAFCLSFGRICDTVNTTDYITRP